jgi:peptidyl-prolyl cis-trans isomerase-like 3
LLSVKYIVKNNSNKMAVTLHTSLGDMKVELFCTRVPKACTNFLALAASGAYNNTLFHRNIRDFIVQGGDPTGSGKGGKSIYGKYFADEIVESLRHDKRGLLSMANRGPDTNGSQFFITYTALPHLDNVNTLFGRVIFGLDVLDAIERSPVDRKDRPIVPVLLESITIHANPFAT